VKGSQVGRKSRSDPMLPVQDVEPREIVCPMVGERDASRVEHLQEQAPRQASGRRGPTTPTSAAQREKGNKGNKLRLETIWAKCHRLYAARKFANTLCEPFKDDKETDLKQTTNTIFPTT
jgi:hypothetical protein